jgi:hypothetical protein
MCLPQVIKSFQNYRRVATIFYPTLVCVIIGVNNCNIIHIAFTNYTVTARKGFRL